MSIKTATWEHSPAHSSISSMAAFTLYQQSCVAAAGPIWPRKPNIFTTEKVCQLCFSVWGPDKQEHSPT